MPGRLTDARLVKRAARGDRDAFAELVARHRDRVWAIALRLCRDRDDAEDVLQETFLAAWRSLDRFGGRSEVTTWLYRIAVNKSYDLIGRRRATATLDELSEPAEPVDARRATGATAGDRGRARGADARVPRRRRALRHPRTDTCGGRRDPRDPRGNGQVAALPRARRGRPCPCARLAPDDCGRREWLTTGNQEQATGVQAMTR